MLLDICRLNCSVNSKRVVLTRGSHFNTIIRRVIFTPLMCRFNFNSRFDSDVGSKWHFDAKEESKWLQISVKRHFWGVNLHSKTPFTRDRIRVVSASSSVSLRSYLLLPLFLWYALIEFCNIISNLRVMLVLRLFKLIWWTYGSGPVWTGSNSFKSHFEMTLWVVKMTLLRGLKWDFTGVNPKEVKMTLLKGSS